MNPEEPVNYQPNPQPQDNRFKTRLILLGGVAFILLIVIAIAALSKHQNGPSTTGSKTNKLSIVSTDPSIGSIRTLTPSLAIHFNQTLSSGSISLASSPQIVSSSSVTGSTLTITFPQRTLVSTKSYTITLKSAASTSGSSLTNKTFTFTPIFSAPMITGEDQLINIGLSTDQVNNLNTYLSQFNPWAQSITIDQSTIKHFKQNPSDPWSPWAVGFTMSIDGTNYNLVGAFNDTEHIQVTITDPTTGKQLFTAGTPGTI